MGKCFVMISIIHTKCIQIKRCYISKEKTRCKKKNSKMLLWLISLEFKFICIALNPHYSLKGLIGQILMTQPYVSQGKQTEPKWLTRASLPVRNPQW